MSTVYRKIKETTSKEEFISDMYEMSGHHYIIPTDEQIKQIFDLAGSDKVTYRYTYPFSLAGRNTLLIQVELMRWLVFQGKGMFVVDSNPEEKYFREDITEAYKAYFHEKSQDKEGQ